MLKNSVRLLLLFMVLVLSCTESNVLYERLSDAIMSAWQTRDRQKMLAVSAEIGNRYMKEGNEGEKYLELNLLALTYAGMYEEAFHVLEEYCEKHGEKYEYLCAKGLLLEGKNKEMAIQYYSKAYEQLKSIPLSQKSEGEKVLEYYIAALLGKTDDPYVKNELYNAFQEDVKVFLDIYRRSNRKELLQSAIIWYIRFEPTP